MDLNPLANPKHPGEWRYGASVPGPWGPTYPVTGYRSPNTDGNTAWIFRRGWRRDELPELIAFLQAVYEASNPRARRRVS